MIINGITTTMAMHICQQISINSMQPYFILLHQTYHYHYLIVYSSAWMLFEPHFAHHNNYKKRETIPTEGCGSPWRCETLRFSYLPENCFTDSAEVVSLMHCPLFTLSKAPGTHFC
jgi:hypothetical protein